MQSEMGKITNLSDLENQNYLKTVILIEQATQIFCQKDTGLLRSVYHSRK